MPGLFIIPFSAKGDIDTTVPTVVVCSFTAVALVASFPPDHYTEACSWTLASPAIITSGGHHVLTAIASPSIPKNLNCVKRFKYRTLLKNGSKYITAVQISELTELRKAMDAGAVRG